MLPYRVKDAGEWSSEDDPHSDLRKEKREGTGREVSLSRRRLSSPTEKSFSHLSEKPSEDKFISYPSSDIGEV